MSTKRFHDLLKDLNGVIHPTDCVWCHVPIEQGRDFCSDCDAKFSDNYYRCRRCATPLSSSLPNDNCFRCREANWKFSQVLTLGRYQGTLREAVVLMKKRGYESLRAGIGRKLGDVVTQCREAERLSLDLGDSPAWIVPVPNHWTRMFAGTANTSLSLARAVGERTGITVRTGIVRRIRKTSKQGMLSWTERKQNVSKAFEVVQPELLTASHIYLVDDVLTSGATCNELAARFLEAGVRRVDVVVAARGTGSREAVMVRAPHAKPVIAPEIARSVGPGWSNRLEPELLSFEKT